jgi:hypothetical protein
LSAKAKTAPKIIKIKNYALSRVGKNAIALTFLGGRQGAQYVMDIKSWRWFAANLFRFIPPIRRNDFNKLVLFPKLRMQRGDSGILK